VPVPPGRVSSRPRGLTARYEVSATTSNLFNDNFPSSDLRAWAAVAYYDLLNPGLHYTITATSPMDQFSTHLVEFQFSWESKAPHSHGEDFPKVGFYGGLATSKKSVEFQGARGGPKSLWGYLPVSSEDHLGLYMNCDAVSSIPTGQYSNEMTGALTLEVNLLSYTRISSTAITDFIDDQIYTLVEVQPGEYGFQHVVSGEIFSPIQLETGKFLLLNERTGEVAVIPLPASVWLLGAGLLGLGWRRRTPAAVKIKRGGRRPVGWW
jgi:hypothetical protein